MSYQLIFQYNLQCPPPNPSHCEGFCRTFHVPSGVRVQRSISERSSQWFIDFLFITRDSRKSNKLCEKSFAVRMIWNSIKAKKTRTASLFLASVFLPVKLSSGSHPVKLNSKRQKRRPLPVVAARLVPSPLRYSGPVIRF